METDLISAQGDPPIAAEAVHPSQRDPQPPTSPFAEKQEAISLLRSGILSTKNGSRQQASRQNSTKSDIEVLEGAFPSEATRITKRSKSGSLGLAPVVQESLVKMLSGLYGLLIVVTGAVFPVVETFASPLAKIFEGFYIYLYSASCVFLMYVYAYLLRRNRADLLRYAMVRRVVSWISTGDRLSRQSSTRSSATENESAVTSFRRSKDSSQSMMSLANSSRHRKPRVAYNEQPNHHTGSFYLRVGCCAFGIGSMIHSGLNFGHYFEIKHLGNACSNAIQAVKPLFHLFFTFFQMYFIFMNSKMCIKKRTMLARFGLMHMAATNICVWLRAIVVQTLHEMQIANRLKLNTSHSINVTSDNGDSYIIPGVTLDPLELRAVKGLLPELQCQWNALMGNVMERSSSFLYPCVIEYSLICASVLYVMWMQVGVGHEPKRRMRHEDTVVSMSGLDTGIESEDGIFTEMVLHQQRMSVDCSGSQRGLFFGLFIFVVAVITLVIFYVLAGGGQSSTLTTAMLLSHYSESMIYVTAIAATGCAGWRMKHMKFSTHRKVGVEQTLALVSLTGLIAFSMFNSVAAGFSPFSHTAVATIISNFLMSIQACLQTVFMLAAMRVSPSCRYDARHKPGRQWVTFLLVVNFALWNINTFETRRMAHNMLQVEFYGSTAWNIFCHVSVPLGIYFRFHSTVCLSNIWKNAWKIRSAF